MKSLASFVLCSVIVSQLNISAAENRTRPNVLFILADDMGWADIGANNPKTFYETPNIDALAKSGMRFTSAYTACPVCSPTRASLLTGKYPPRTGITDYIGNNRPGKLLPATNHTALALSEFTVAEAFHEAGYSTFFAGKWHLGDGKFSPTNQGFEGPLIGANQFYYPADIPPVDANMDGKTTDCIADAAVRFIETHREKPFFAYLPFLAPHIPVQARPDLVAKYEKKKATAPPDSWGKDRHSQVRLVQNRADYAAMMEQLDTAIGRVIAALKKNGLDQRTIVIFTSDNGGLSTAEGHPTSNLPWRAGKGWLYEGGVRVPLIVVAPGVTRAGVICESPVTSPDFYPTLLELSGLTLRPQQHVDGKSFVKLLKGETAERGPLYWHYPHYGNQGGSPGGSVRDGNWKLIHWYETGGMELYNLESDPSERTDLARSNPERVKSLFAMLEKWKKDVGAIMPTPNPNPPKEPAPWPAP